MMAEPANDPWANVAAPDTPVSAPPAARIAGVYGTPPQQGADAVSIAGKMVMPPDVALHTLPDSQTAATIRERQQTVAGSPALSAYVGSAPEAHVTAIQDDLPALAKIGAILNPAANIGHAFLESMRAGEQAQFIEHTTTNPLEYFKAKGQEALAGFGMLTSPFAAITEPLAHAINQLPASTYSRVAAARGQPQRAELTPGQKFSQSELAANLLVSFAPFGEFARKAPLVDTGEAVPGARTGPAPEPTPGGVWPVNEHGYVTDPTGAPVVFSSAREAANARAAAASAGLADRNFEVANHPGEPGYTLRDVQAVTPGARFDANAPVGANPVTDNVRGAVAKLDEQYVAATQDAIAESKVATRSPEVMSDFLSQQPGANTIVRVDPDKLVELAGQGHDLGPLGELDVSDHLLNGTDVEVPYHTYLAATAGKPWAAELNAATAFREGGVSVGDAEALALRAPLPEVKVTPSEVAPPEGVSAPKTLAADAASGIETLLKEHYLAPLISDAKALGMNEDQLARFANGVQEAAQRAHERVQERVYAQLQRERKPEFTEAVKDHLPTARAQVEDLPIVRASRQLAEPGYKLDRDLTAHFFPEPASRIPANRMVKGGNHPDVAADQLGYPSGAQLVSDLADLHEAVKAHGGSLNDYVNAQAKALAEQHARDTLGFDTFPDIVREEVNKLVAEPQIEQFLGSELRAIARANGGKIDLAAVKEHALDAFGSMRVADARAVGKVHDTVNKAAIKAERALLKGDYPKAFLEAQRRFIQHLIFKQANKFAKEFAADTKRFGKLARKKSIAGIEQDFLDQIHAELAQLGYNVPKGNLAFAEEQGAPVVPETEPAIVKEMSVDQFREAADRVKSLEYLGRDALKLRVGEKERAMADIVAEAQRALEGVPRKKNPTLETPRKLATLTDLPQFLTGLDTEMWKPETLIDKLDNGNPNGVFNQVLMRPAREAAGTYTDVVRDGIGKWMLDRTKRLSPEQLARWEQRLPAIEGLPTTGDLIVKDLIGAMMNLGNESGRYHLFEGGRQWNEDALLAALEQHTRPEDVEFVADVLDQVGKPWPQIAENAKQMTGVAPEKVAAVPFTVHGLEVPGGYFPLVRRTMPDTVDAEALSDPSKLFEAHFQNAGTPSSFEKTRTGARYPVSLDWEHTISEHIDDVGKRTAYGRYVMDAAKFLRQPEIQQLIREVVGPDGMRQFTGWIHRQVNFRMIDPRVPTKANQVFRFLRMGAYAAEAGYKLGIMAEHATSLAQSFAVAGYRIPAAGYIRAGQMFAQDPGSASRFVNEASPYMRARGDAADLNLRDYLLTVGHGNRALPFKTPLDRPIELFQRGFGHLMNWINHKLVAEPLWLGAYQAAREGKAFTRRGGALPAMAHEDAVSFADKTVGKSHGSGLEVDMGAWQSGGKNEAVKLMNMFNVFGGTAGNIVREAVDVGMNATDARQRLAGLHQFLWAAGGLAVIAKLVTDEGPKDLKPADVGAWLADAMISGTSKAIMFGPQAYWALHSADVKRHKVDIELSSAQGALASGAVGALDLGINTAHLFGQAKGVQPSKREYQNMGALLAILTHLPLGQISNTTQALVDINHGNVPRPAQALVYGPSHERKR